ncbi:MAG: hypothetical protein PHF51_00150 [Candidatus ainarchaeum sp.]|nr:hypothetical protein [Candidatus ainarchaeum sp.]
MINPYKSIGKSDGEIAEARLGFKRLEFERAVSAPRLADGVSRAIRLLEDFRRSGDGASVEKAYRILTDAAGQRGHPKAGDSGGGFGGGKG